MESTKENTPNAVATAKAGKYQATVFKNERVSSTGNKFDSYSVQLQKSWLKQGGDSKNKDDWENQRMSLFNAQECRQAITALEEVEKKLLTGVY